MKEITIENDSDILDLKLIEALGLLTSMTIQNGYDDGVIVVDKINTNYGSFKYNITCEKIIENDSFFNKIKRWFK